MKLAKQRDMYAQAGVDVDENDLANKLIIGLARATLEGNPNVVREMEGLFSTGYRMDRSRGNSFGQRLVAVDDASHLEREIQRTLRNIQRAGAEPLFMTDYIAFGKMRATTAARTVLDIMEASRRPDGSFVPLIGGETAEMPGVINPDGVEILLTITYQDPKKALAGSVDLSRFSGNILTASIDSVGTKTKLGKLLKMMDGLFKDMIGHSVGDISVPFARPFGVAMYVGHSPSFRWPGMRRTYEESLGYAGTGTELHDLDFRKHKKDIYCDGQFDIVGGILGVLDEKDLLTGRNIQEGDYLLGLKCFGLNTNGYSLVRRLAEKGKINLDEELPGTGMTVGESLMVPHENYGAEVWSARRRFGKNLKGAAHITGGGIEGNTKRLLPKGLRVEIDILPENTVFNHLQDRGEIDEVTMNKTYNRGIGLVYVVDKGFDVGSLPERYTVIGTVQKVAA